MNRLGAWIRKYILGVDDRPQLEFLVEQGLKLGKNVNIMGECILDPGHCWLIEIGDNVTLAPRVHILAHDASMKKCLGYTKIANVKIGTDVFVGANSVLLPGVEIGNKVIIGAGSVVSKSIPDNSVAVGSPAKVIKTYDEYMEEKAKEVEQGRVFDESYHIHNISMEKKDEMKNLLDSQGQGYII